VDAAAMNARQLLEHEIRAVAGEMVSALRNVSEGVLPIRRSDMRALCVELEHELTNLGRLSDQLP
jgi:hypothetical protein